MKGKQALNRESSQLYNREVFQPVMLSNLTKEEREKAISSLKFLTKNRDGTMKARACANGSTQRSYINKHEASSQTVTTKALLITASMDLKQNRDVITLDIPNVFVQTPMPERDQN